MGFLDNVLSSTKRTIASYTGDTAFLAAACAAAANVTAADGSIDEDEIESALSGMMANAIIAKSYTPAKIEEAFNLALASAKSRAGRITNKRSIEAVATRAIELRQDIFLIAADVADNGGIGAEEQKVLDDIAKSLNVDGAKLLG